MQTAILPVRQIRKNFCRMGHNPGLNGGIVSMKSAISKFLGTRLAASALVPALGLLVPLVVLADQAVLHMEIGDPARKGREIPVVLDGITDTATGDLVTPEEMAKRLANTGILFIGENHTNQEFHDVQFRTIRALREAGREGLIGLSVGRALNWGRQIRFTVLKLPCAEDGVTVDHILGCARPEWPGDPPFKMPDSAPPGSVA